MLCTELQCSTTASVQVITVRQPIPTTAIVFLFFFGNPLLAFCRRFFFRKTSGCNTVSNEVKSEILNLIFYFIWITISQSFCDLKYDGSLSCTLTSVYVVEIISFNHINLQCVEKHIINWDELYINRPIEKCYSFQYWLFFMFSSTHTVPGMEVEDVGVFVVVVEITVRTVHVYIISNFSTLLP